MLLSKSPSRICSQTKQGRLALRYVTIPCKVGGGGSVAFWSSNLQKSPFKLTPPPGSQAAGDQRDAWLSTFVVCRHETKSLPALPQTSGKTANCGKILRIWNERDPDESLPSGLPRRMVKVWKGVLGLTCFLPAPLAECGTEDHLWLCLWKNAH